MKGTVYYLEQIFLKPVQAFTNCPLQVKVNTIGYPYEGGWAGGGPSGKTAPSHNLTWSLTSTQTPSQTRSDIVTTLKTNCPRCGPLFSTNM